MNTPGGILADRFIGAALGTFTGDALGMPFEGLSAEAVALQWKEGGVMLSGRLPRGCYTDDTEMMIALLESLVEKGCFDPGAAAQKFLENFHPWRGYGGRIYGIMEQLRRGACWDQVGTDSFGNGSAMRVAPVGLFYFDNAAQIAEAAARSSSITHRHSEAIAGAVALALAVGRAVSLSLENRPLNPRDFLNALLPAVAAIDSSFGSRLASLAEAGGAGRTDAGAELRARFACSVKAIEAVPPAVGAFLYTAGFREALTAAVSLGGDTDTIGAMTGALAGAYYGYRNIPPAWLAVLENEGKGRDYVVRLAARAADMVAQRVGKYQV